MDTGYVIERNGRYPVYLPGDRIFWSKSLIDAKLFDSMADAMNDPIFTLSTMVVRKIQIKLVEDGNTRSK